MPPAFRLVLLLLTLLLPISALTTYGPRRPRIDDPSQPPPNPPPKRDRTFRPEDAFKPRSDSARRPGYVRMPVSRHTFNGTGKWSWGWHWGGGPGPGGPLGGLGGGWGGPNSPPGYGSPWGPGGGPWAQGGGPGGGPWGQGGDAGGQGGGGGGWSGRPTGTGTGTGTGRAGTRPTGWGGWPGWGSGGGSSSSSSSAGAAATSTTTEVSASVAPRALERRQSPDQDRRWGWAYLNDIGGIAYVIELEIGTPAQAVKVFIDTGSYELWVNPRCSTSASYDICTKHGIYYPQKSNSSTYVGGNFAVAYGTGAVRGSYWSDIMNVAMFRIPSVQFAVASDSNYTYSGILGLGYGYPYVTKYPSILNLMVAQNQISAPIFSIGLGGDGDNFSEIIFGGVNRWKYFGYLEPVPIWPSIKNQDPRWIQYWVNVTGMGVTRPGQTYGEIYTSEDFVMPCLIDTGSTLSYIRSDLAALIAEKFNATMDRSGNYIVDCAYRNKPGTVQFQFNRGKLQINVRYKDFIFQSIPDVHCMLGVQPQDPGSTNYVLGDTFIRAAYLVFDQQSEIIWMQQYYNCGDQVAPVGQTPRDTQYVKGAC